MKSYITLICVFLFQTQIISQDLEITFESDGLALEGTLSLPENGSGPYPIAILVHGSGPSDRNQSIKLSGGNAACLYPELLDETIRNFKDIADILAKNKIAVLRYDKRTFTHGQTLNEKEILVSDFIKDIEGAIKFCKERVEVDQDKIFLIGHSQGSGLIPIAASNSQNIRGLISLAGPTTPIDSLLPEQIRYLYEECANDPATGENIANQFYHQFNEIRNGTFPLDQQVTIIIPNTSTSIPQGYGSFWNDWIIISDSVISNYRNSNTKSLVIQGDEDLNVPSTDALEFEALKNSKTYIYSGINHFLTKSNENTVDTNILNDIVKWINSCLTSNANVIESQDTLKFRVYREIDRVKIVFESQCENCEVRVCSLLGRLIDSKNISSNKCEMDFEETNNLIIVSVVKKGVVYTRLVN